MRAEKETEKGKHDSIGERKILFWVEDHMGKVREERSREKRKRHWKDTLYA